MATADVHAPRYLLLYLDALARAAKSYSDVELVIFAGDMVDKGRVEALASVLAYTRKFYPKARIVAVFGNEEYIGTEEMYKTRYKDITWLDDNYIIIDDVCIYGSRGALDRPTAWQRRNMPQLWRVYRERVERIRKTLTILRSKCRVVILVTHYVPTYLTLEGEPRSIWPEMGCKALENVILDTNPDMVLHGHAHKSQRLEVVLGKSRVYNVSLPARRSLLLLEV